MSYTNINKSSLHMNTKLWSGNGSTNAISGIGFQPDLVWSKARSGGNVNDHRLIDAVRGATKNIYSNASTSEETDANGLTAFNTDGFTMGNSNGMNNSSTSYVSWNWKANGQGSSNTDGSINTTYTSVNTTAGFSISTYTGSGGASTVGHGLGAVPKMIIVKKRSGASYDESWYVYHEALGNTHALSLNSDGASSDVNVWNDTTPTSSVFSVGNDSTNRSGNLFVAYCFAEKQGYSKFGSYVGNNQTGNNAPFIYTGFKPTWLMVKKYSSTNHWIIWDNKRSTKNGANIIDKKLYANLSNAENGADDVSFLSNGFKFNTNTGDWNENNSYIYMAFGQSLVGSNNVPCTAR